MAIPQDFNYRLNDKQKSNKPAVYGPLESDYGMVYKWFEGDAMGAPKAVLLSRSGFCKVVYTTAPSSKTDNDPKILLAKKKASMAGAL